MEYLQALREFAGFIVGQADVQFLLAFVVINLVAALAAAIRTGKFKLHKVGEFLYRKLLPYVLLYGVVRVIGSGVNLNLTLWGVAVSLDWLVGALWLMIAVTLAADLAENLSILGVPMPDQIVRLVNKE